MAALTREPVPGPSRELKVTPGREVKVTAACAQNDGEEDGDVSIDVLALLRLRDQMKEQLMEYKTALLASRVEPLNRGTEEEFIQSATEDLEDVLEEAKISFHNKTSALKRIQIMDALRNKLKQGDEDSRLIKETMDEIVLLSRTIIEQQRRACLKEEQLSDIKRKRLSLKQDGQHKLQQIQSMMKDPKKKQASVTDLESMLDKLEKERQMASLIQSVFQILIIGSRVNWAENPSLKKIVLQSENLNVYLQ